MRFSFSSGKNAKFPYFAKGVLSALIPPVWFRCRRERLLRSLEKRSDREEILARVAYYNKLSGETDLPETALTVGTQRVGRKGQVYYLDSREFLRYFPPRNRFLLLPGDITHVPEAPTLLKSRPIAADASNANSVLLNLNKVRHFIFVKDALSFSEKLPLAVFRGKVHNKTKRIALFRKYFGKAHFDLGDTAYRHPTQKEWLRPKLSLREQLRYRFILSIEGNDVASNLKWILSSNSLAVMPRPQYETWFQEGLLQPGVHFIEVRPDYADLPEKIAWYNAHPEACEAILKAQHAFVARFLEPSREKLVSLLVLQKYFLFTNGSRRAARDLS